MMRHRPFTLLLVLLLLAVVGGGVMWQRPTPTTGHQDATPPPPRSAAPAVQAQQQAAADTGVVTSPQPQAFSKNADPTRYRRAYILALEGDRLTLENTQDIEGDFAPRRQRTEEEWSGMLRCRLVSATGAVLAEELIPAPDQLCTVLDDRSGTAKPVSFAVPRPVVFQLRLPRLANAARLDIARITDSGSLKRDQPIGSISLTSR